MGKNLLVHQLGTILEVLEAVLVIYFNDNLYLPNNISPKILKMLKWLEFSHDIYTKKINLIFLHTKSVIDDILFFKIVLNYR